MTKTPEEMVEDINKGIETIKADLEKAVKTEDLEAVSKTIEDLKESFKEFDVEKIKEQSEEIEKLKKDLENTKEDYDTKLREQGTDITKMKNIGLVNNDFSVNKSILRTLVEKHLEKSGLLADETVNENGLKVKEVKLPSNKSIGDSADTQVGDIRKLSKKYIAQKAGENMYVGGAGTQAVSGQAINRDPFGDIAPPLTANEHALDIFSVSNISGSLMNLMIYENLEANGELVAEGAAPSADSRIEKNDKDFKVFDFSATATVSKNLLRDSGEVIDELVRQLASDIKSVLDDYLFTSGGDNTATPWGVFNTTHSCENFNPLLFTGSSPKANIISVIGKAKLQARLNDWATDSTIIHPKQGDEIEDLKDADENSIKDNRLAVNGVGEVIAVKGMRKYQTTKIPDGSVLVFNSNLQAIGLRQDIETQFGHNTDDLKKRKVSFIMDMRGAYGQKAKKSSIYVTSIDEAIAILKESAAASLTRVQGYATGSDASELTIATLSNAGVTGLIDANLATYAASIAAEASIANLAALQAVIDADN